LSKERCRRDKYSSSTTKELHLYTNARKLDEIDKLFSEFLNKFSRILCKAPEQAVFIGLYVISGQLPQAGR
jgi:hypothetical protein